MSNQDLLGRIAIGTMVSFAVMYILEQIDNRLAMLYLMVVILGVMLTYKDQIFPSLNLLIGVIKGGTK